MATAVSGSPTCQPSRGVRLRALERRGKSVRRAYSCGEERDQILLLLLRSLLLLGHTERMQLRLGIVRICCGARALADLLLEELDARALGSDRLLERRSVVLAASGEREGRRDADESHELAVATSITCHERHVIDPLSFGRGLVC